MRHRLGLNFEAVSGIFFLFCFLVYVLGFFWSHTWFRVFEPLMQLVGTVPLADLVFKRFESLGDTYAIQRFHVTFVFMTFGFVSACLIMLLAGLKYDGDPPFNLNGQSIAVILLFCAIGVSMLFFPSSLGQRTQIGKLILQSDFFFLAFSGIFFFVLCLAYFVGHRAKLILKRVI
jgi:hypothetical protein